MARARAVLGLIAGVVIGLSSFAHSLAGWPKLRSDLVKSGTPADLIKSVELGWQFAGMAILVFGIISIFVFVNRLRRRQQSGFATLVIGIAYVVIGIWALAMAHVIFFLWVFVVPGALLIVASY